MKRLALIALVALSACREEQAAIPGPVTMTESAVGHFCQMNVLEHPGPKAQVHLKDVMDPLFFSQVRDAIAYQRMPEQSHEVIAVYVSDIAQAESWDFPGADNWIAQESAVYVLGSDREGGMGAAETIPFSTREAAEAFIADHGGEIRALDQITTEEVLSPDDGASAAAEDDSAGDYADRLRRLGRD
ncbi:MAG: nitrous oxide reductase accessory protein NosL [Paracoccus sp. (in: a-proteobacteria)]|nr:nitrous oxide reductase accessory protein NosL [Paracoccus sp. (in: a-proteobacteria)]